MERTHSLGSGLGVITMSGTPNCKLFEEPMSRSRCYLDYNATAPLHSSARQACIDALDAVGNPSSIHSEGRRSRQIVETARESVGALVRAPADRVVFTSGGTEGAALALSPTLQSRRGPPGVGRLLLSSTEHAAVLHGHRFPADRVRLIAVRPDGLLDGDDLAAALEEDAGTPALVAVQAANNETGVIQPIAEIAAQVHAEGGLVVCDAVQAAGRIPFELEASGADILILSGHKLGGPKGVGAVVLAEGVSFASPLIGGGGQERGLRSGTENVPGIAGFGAAAREVLMRADGPRLLALRERLERLLQGQHPGIVVFGRDADRLPNTTCFALPAARAETLVMALDMEGVAVSSGSACSSGKVASSHVLAAMGDAPHVNAGALRVSTGPATTEAEVDQFIEALGSVMHRMQRRSVPAAA